MPTQEAVSGMLIPRVEVTPIPTRTVSTKPKKVTPVATDTGQPVTNNNPGAVETPAAATEESVRLSPQLSALARKEQAFRQREAALKEREKALEATLADGDKYKTLKAKLSEKDFAEAEALGLDYEAYTQYRLDKINGENPLEEKIKALEAKIETLSKGNEESAAAQYEETVAEYKKEIAKAVSENPDFSTIKGIKGGEQAVLQLILDSFEEDGEELTIMEAARLIEDKLVENGKVFTTLPKFKKEDVVAEKPLPRPMVGKTLTNDMTAGSQKKPLTSLQKLSQEERYAEARRRVIERRQGN